MLPNICPTKESKVYICARLKTSRRELKKKSTAKNEMNTHTELIKKATPHVFFLHIYAVASKICLVSACESHSTLLRPLLFRILGIISVAYGAHFRKSDNCAWKRETQRAQKRRPVCDIRQKVEVRSLETPHPTQPVNRAIRDRGIKHDLL